MEETVTSASTSGPEWYTAWSKAALDNAVTIAGLSAEGSPPPRLLKIQFSDRHYYIRAHWNQKQNTLQLGTSVRRFPSRKGGQSDDKALREAAVRHALRILAAAADTKTAFSAATWSHLLGSKNTMTEPDTEERHYTIAARRFDVCPLFVKLGVDLAVFPHNHWDLVIRHALRSVTKRPSGEEKIKWHVKGPRIDGAARDLATKKRAEQRVAAIAARKARLAAGSSPQVVAAASKTDKVDKTDVTDIKVMKALKPDRAALRLSAQKAESIIQARLTGSGGKVYKTPTGGSPLRL